MYIINYNKLAVELKEGKLPQKEQLKYLLATLLLDVVISVSYDVSDSSSEVTYSAVVVELLLIASIYIVGVLACYHINQRGDNKDFLLRFFCLSLPVKIRLALYFIAVMIIMMSLDISQRVSIPEKYEEIILLTPFVFVYYVIIYRKMKFISSATLSDEQKG